MCVLIADEGHALEMRKEIEMWVLLRVGVP